MGSDATHGVKSGFTSNHEGRGYSGGESIATSTQKPELGFLIILLLPTLAAFASFKDLYLAGMNYLVPVTLGTPLVLAAMTLVKVGLQPDRLRVWTGHKVWLAWYAVIWGSLFWGHVHDAEALKHSIELSTPYLFGIVGATFITNQQQMAWLLRAIGFAVIPSMFCVVLWKIGVVDAGEFSSGPAIDQRPHSMSLVPIAALALALLPNRIVLSAVIWGVCLLISGIEGSRGVSLCLLLLPMFHPMFRGLRWKLAAGVAVAMMGLIVFHLPPMQERLFPDTGSGTISDLLTSKQSGMGRFDAWPVILDRAWNRPMLGHGVSSIFHFVPTIWPRMRSAHNEFLSVFYEMGVVGLAVYIGAMLVQIRIVKRRLTTAHRTNQIALITVLLALIGFNLLALTDNPMSSNVRFLNPLFLVLGAALSTPPWNRGQDEAGDGPSDSNVSESAATESAAIEYPESRAATSKTQSTKVHAPTSKTRFVPR